MTAEVLRQAAALMRERAEKATPGPWQYDLSGGVAAGVITVVDYAAKRADSHHIASWHPAVALAVADWLDNEALVVEEIMQGNHTTVAYFGPPFEVAHAYLGDQS